MLPLAHVGFTMAATKIAEKGLRLRNIDYRVLIVASMLPDLIDKPLSSLLGGGYIYETRAFGHTLAFLGCIGLFMIFQWLWLKNLWLFPVFYGILVHDLLDEMWLQAGTFLWPLLGWQFPKPTDEVWQRFVQLEGYKIRQLDFFDNISVLVLLYFFMKIALEGRILDFLRRGRL